MTRNEPAGKNEGSRYIGRGQELERVISHIGSPPPYQIFLVLGPGGAGKTTLLRMTEDKLGGARSPVYIDCKNCFDHLDSFTRLLARTLGIAEGKEPDWTGWPGRQDSVLLVDSFEMMGPYQAGLVGLLSVLAREVPVVIASRTAPDLGMKALEVPPFGRDDITDYLLNAGLPAEMAEDACRFSEGNPLLLSLFTLAASASKNPAEINRASIESDFVSFIISEVTGDEVFELLEAASLIHSFTWDLLEHMLSSQVDPESFRVLTGLSFITQDAEGWQIHEVVSKSLRNSLKQYGRRRYYELKLRALEYYDREEHRSPGKNYLIHRVYMCEDDFSREVFFSMGINLEREGIYFSPARASDLPNIPDFWRNSMLVTGFPAGILSDGYEDTARLVEYAAEYIRILRDRDDSILGYHATVPICASTFGYFRDSPATREYIASLPQRELAYLQKTSAGKTDTFFIRHLNPSDISNPLITAALLQDIFLVCIGDGCRAVTTIPLDLFQSLVDGLGFRQLPGIFDTTLGMKWPAYELDFRHTSINLWYQWLAMGRTLPHWLHIILTYTRQYWREQIELVLDNLHNPRFLNHHPLSPLAEEACPQGADDGPALKRLVLDLASSLAEDDRSNGTGRYSPVGLGGILLTTFAQKTTREEAAARLNLPPTTYYRRLKQAKSALADRMFQTAVETAEARYARLELEKEA
ncbi:MAG: hypothetical protein HPY50_08555 [Firmicutes bacterium]|nr:hypothetical protein [Bacillota bacterium]